MAPTAARERVPAGVEIRRAGSLDQLRDGWDELAEGSGHPFGSFEWVSAWWQSYGDAGELFVHAVYEDGRLAAILPLHASAPGGLRVGRFIGYADLQSPLCAPADRPLAAAAMRRLLGAGSERCALLLLERMPGEQRWGDLLGGSAVKADADPVLNLGGRSWEEYEASLTSKLRKRSRYQRRRLERDHDLSFELCADPGEVDRAMDDLIALHERRFGAGSTGIFSGERAAMQRRFAAAALARGWLRLWIERVDGRPAAAYYGIRYAGSEFFFQSGRDPAFDRLSVGSVLLMRVLEDACGAGVSEFRFLAGDESYKLRLADERRFTETRLLAARRPLERAGGAVIRRVFELSSERRGRLLAALGR